MAEPSWSVVCTADEPLPLLAAFASYHLALGAAEVHLYLDRPRRHPAEGLGSIEGLRLVVCDAAYWQGARPKSTESRQRDNAFDAYSRTRADWLCHIDSDEFIAPRAGRGVAAVLADQPDSVDAVVPQMQERAYLPGQPVAGLFDGAAIRAHAPDALPGPVPPGLDARAPYGNQGLLGHAMGKSFVRTRRPLVPGIHRPRPSRTHPHRALGRKALAFRRTADLRLTHFDGLTPFHWVAKLWRMAGRMPEARLAVQGAGRQRLIREARATLPEVAPLRALGQRLRHLDPASIDRLRAAGLLDTDLPDPAGPAVARGLLHPRDLVPAAFDREMVAMYPRLAPVFEAWQALEHEAPFP